MWAAVEVTVVSLASPGLEGHALSPQIALIDLLTSMGLRPDGIIGHSLGEVACGYADGCVSQEEAILAAYWRGQCIKEANIPPGAMAAVGRGPPPLPQPTPLTGLRLGASSLAPLMSMLGRSRNVGSICWPLSSTRSDLDALLGCLHPLWPSSAWRPCCPALLLMDMSESQPSFHRNLS